MVTRSCEARLNVAQRCVAVVMGIFEKSTVLKIKYKTSKVATIFMYIVSENEVVL